MSFKIILSVLLTCATALGHLYDYSDPYILENIDITTQKIIRAPINDSLILGRYRMTSDPWDGVYEIYSRSMGYDNALVKYLSQYKIIVTVSKDEDGYYTFKLGIGDMRSVQHFKPGVKFDDKLLNGKVCSTSVIMESNIITHDTKCPFPEDSYRKIGTHNVARFYRKYMYWTRTAWDGTYTLQKFERSTKSSDEIDRGYWG